MESADSNLTMKMPSSIQMKKPNFSNQPINKREKINWYIHVLFIKQQYDDCLKLIDDQLNESQEKSEYALYVKALILRIKGNIHESLELFKKCHLLNPTNIDYLKQFGRSLYLLGRHKAAIEVFDECLNLDNQDWEVFYYKGLSYKYLRIYDQAIQCFQQANEINRHDQTYMELGKTYAAQQDYKSAIEVYLEGLEQSPENSELLTTIGLLYIRLGENFQAFQFLGNSLTIDPRSTKSILAAGSIIQDKSDHDAALLKYRIAAVHNPDSAELWNNIGMCFFGKQKYVASIACLKRALYLDPFQWIAAYNLGLVHLNTEQYASAFHYFSAAINLKPDFSTSYMYLAITLNKLKDFENSCGAFQKALQMDNNDCTIYLNYAITLYNNGQSEKAREMFQQSEKIFETLDDEDKEPEMLDQRSLLMDALNINERSLKSMEVKKLKKMLLNKIVFPAPNCSYTTEKLFKDLVYIPKTNLKTNLAESIPCLYLPHENETKILLFFHGNAEDVGIAFDVLQELKNCLKLSVLAMEYPGYGLYHGSPDSDQMLEDALYLYDHLIYELGVAQSDIIIFGRSIGSSAACHVAKQREPASLILMSPFKSIRDTARDLVGWLLSKAIADRFRNIDIIKDVRCPTLIIHGQKDKLIPYQHSQELHDNAVSSQYCKLVLPPQMDHNDFEFDADLIEPLTEFFKQIGMKMNKVAKDFHGIKFNDDYYFPPPTIVLFEKKLIKSSIIWDIIEDRKRQAEIKIQKQQRIGSARPSLQEEQLQVNLNLSNKIERMNIHQEVRENNFKRLSAGTRSPVVIKNMVNSFKQPTLQEKTKQFIRKQSQERKSYNTSFENKAALNNKIQKLLDNGYQWDKDRSMGVKKTEERISIKFK
eukprot:403365040